MDSTFVGVFKKATGNAPYPYQVRFATSESIPSLLSVPTGLGKTAAAILGWVWRRRFADEKTRRATPRRLVYCLPMRVLVEQTLGCAESWLEKLGLLGEGPDKVGVHLLMGGDVDQDWDLYPERDAILIGTQDMLLSRALNRGYAASRFRWPVQFGLLNSDCQWVMDEVQLMGNGLATTAQLQAFRRTLGTVGEAGSTWMSATMRPEWLSTVDFDLANDAPLALSLAAADRALPAAKKRLEAPKAVAQSPDGIAGDVAKEAKFIAEEHVDGSLTLVVVNTVKRAIALRQEIAKKRKDVEVLLLHSRFRAPDRKAILDKLFTAVPDAGRIVVSTQVVEAGVDLSARTLFTDLAPWPSMVQRFGRCNRAGEFDDAAIFWFDVNKTPAPYTDKELVAARANLDGLDDASPAVLPDVDGGIGFTHVIRRKDIVELFDTTPDLAGADVDVSRFIREADEHHVQVFWRDLDEHGPAESEPGPARDELCSVPIADIDLKSRPAWRWDHLDRGWVRAFAVHPGMVLLLRASEGGYSTDSGWTGTRSGAVAPIAAASRAPEGEPDDPHAKAPSWQTLADHTNAVVEMLDGVLDALGLATEGWAQQLRTAARWHDAGKAHPQFQEALGTPPSSGTWGKAPSVQRYTRPGFRHELPAALAMLAHGLPDLAVYLAASHHGKVRLSIRSLPHEKRPDDPLRRFARGIWDGEVLPAADLGGGVATTETALDLSCMEMGEGASGPSWLARMLSVRSEHGPFRLAFLESLLRAADRRASAEVK